MRNAFLVSVGLGCCAVALPARGEYFPIEEGIVWRYEVTLQSQVQVDMRFFAGTMELNNTTTHILNYVGGWDGGLQQYWSRKDDGDIYFHGFDREFGAHYSPPFLMLDVPLFVGKTWDTFTLSPFELNLHFEVLAEEAITVPAGTFQCFTIEMTQSLPLAFKVAQSDVLGRRLLLNGGPTGTLQSYADEVGLAQEGLGLVRTERLFSIETDQVAVQPATWSGIRQLYRSGLSHSQR